MYNGKVMVVQVDTFQGDEFRAFLFGEMDRGMCSTGWDFGAGSSNKLWPGHAWKEMMDVLNL
jgi:hypothetical protein